MDIIQKEIPLYGGYSGDNEIIACDSKCNKAWGINNRPRVQLDPINEDDYYFIPDTELGEAPEDPGIYEGFEMCAKPKRLEDRLNKWCYRECERKKCFKIGEPIILDDWSKRQYNIQRWGIEIRK